MSAVAYEGGCLCGAVRYRAMALPLRTLYCHCSMCRRASGAPVVAWVMFPLESFAYTRGTPRSYTSSTWASRQFCEDCGTPLVCRLNEGAVEIDVNVTTLDDPVRVTPSAHIWTSASVPWLELADGLPRHERERPT